MKKLLRLTFTLLMLCIFLMLNRHASAAEPPKEPLLRIETGRHTAMINRITADASGRWLVTASDDKTLRVWDLNQAGSVGSEGGTEATKPARIIRPPIGEGNEGKLFSVAISPDDATIACGGWTKLGSETGHTIYIFNRATGTLINRITGLPNVIFHLAFSPDGRYLAAALGQNNGIRIYHTTDWSSAGEDKDYGGGSYSAHFSKNGRLVTTSSDGYIRLYSFKAGGFNQIAKIKAPGGSQPFSARFSPDGSRIAVGYDDTTAVSMLSGDSLTLLYSPDISGVERGDMGRVAWSADGRYLYAGGKWNQQFDAEWKFPIRRWSDGGRGGYSDTAATDGTIMDLYPLPDGRIAFGSGDPAFGLLDSSGKRTLFIPPAIADFPPASKEKFLLSNDGSQVGFGYEQRGKSPATFDLTARTLTLGEPDLLTPPVTTRQGINIIDWNNTTAPKLNGAPLKLNQYETSRSLAIALDGDSFVLGTGWSLRRFNRLGEQLWEIPAPATVWAVNIAPNGTVAVAAYGDGTIRWHRMSDGRELAAFFPHADKKRWVLWTPSGYYDSSSGGEELIGWHINNGKDKAADFFPASRFRAAYYRPDVIAKTLDTLDENEAKKLADAEAGRRAVPPPSIAAILPPVVTIISPDDGSRVTGKEVTIRFLAHTPSGEPVTAVRALIDGRPVESSRGLKAVAKNSTEQSLTVTIPERDCELSIIAENRNAASEPAKVRLSWSGKKSDEFVIQPKLYLLAVGVSRYGDSQLTLKYAAKDARDFSAAMQRQKGGLYRDVSVKLLDDEKATKDNILDGLEWIQKETTSKDVAIIFIAGHGVNDPSGLFYYLPQNADTEKMKRSGVAFSDIKNTIASIAGKALLFIDTCHSGNVMGTRRGGSDITAVVNELASSENGAVVFASSTGKQYSLEDDKWGNGAFTKALVEGVNGKADYNGKGRITINMLDLWLSERVKELTGGKQTPTTTKPQTVPDFPLVMKR